MMIVSTLSRGKSFDGRHVVLRGRMTAGRIEVSLVPIRQTPRCHFTINKPEAVHQDGGLVFIRAGLGGSARRPRSPPPGPNRTA
jgi:hypothetical protein